MDILVINDLISDCPDKIEDLTGENIRKALDAILQDFGVLVKKTHT